MNAHFRQPLPNRRFRRLLPAALAAAALAAAGFAGPARADAPAPAGQTRDLGHRVRDDHHPRAARPAPRRFLST